MMMMMMMKMSLPALAQSRNLVVADADALISAFADRAYDEARTRARDERLAKVIDANRPRGHWDKVRKEIAKRTGKQIGIDTATRYS
jgi:hypothetical protein